MKSAMKFLWFPASVLMLVVLLIRLDPVLGWRGVRLMPLGIGLVAAGAGLSLWCTVVFFRIGRGTPNPFTAKTKNLVTSGPYGVVRNPMMYGIGTALVGIALWIGAAALWIGIAFFILWIWRFVPLFEEPDLERRFGEQYREYCRRVPRWLPRKR